MGAFGLVLMRTDERDVRDAAGPLKAEAATTRASRVKDLSISIYQENLRLRN
jgi:hypothetical protein